MDTVNELARLINESETLKEEKLLQERKEANQEIFQDSDILEQDLHSFLDNIKKTDEALRKGASQSKKQTNALPPIRNQRDPHSSSAAKDLGGGGGGKAKKEPAKKEEKKLKHNYDYYGEWDKYDPDKELAELEAEETQQHNGGTTLRNEPRYHDSFDPSTMSEQQRLFSAKREKEKGNECYKCGEYTQAIAFFSRSLQLNPKDAVLYSNRAQAYIMIKEFSKAEADGTMAIELKRDWAKPYFRRGIARRRLTNYNQALQDFEIALRLDPGNKEAEKQLNEVKKRLEEIKQHQEWSTKKRMVIEEVDDDDEDEDDEDDHDDDDANAQVKQVKEELKKIESKSAPIQQLQQPAARSTTSTTSTTSSTSSTTSSSSSSAAAAHGDQDNGEADKERGNALFRQGDLNAALAAYSTAIRKNPRNVTFWCNRAQVHISKSQWIDAEADCTAALKLDNTAAKAYYRRAIARRNMGNLGGAEGDINHVLAVEPKNAQAIAEQKQIKEMLQGQTKKKIPVQTVDDDDDDGDEEEEEKVKPIQTKQAAATSSVRTEEKKSIKIEMIDDDEDEDDESATVETKVETKTQQQTPKPDQAKVEASLKHKEAGVEKYRIGQYHEALEAFNKSLSLLPEHNDCLQERANILNNRALIWKQLEDHKNVIQDTSSVLEIEPRNIKALLRRGLAYEALEDYDKAVRDMNTALYYDSTVAMARDTLSRVVPLARSQQKNKIQKAAELKEQGNVAFGTKKYGEAVVLFERAIELDGGNAVYHANLAAAHQALGNHQPALTAAENCLKLQHDHAKAWYRKCSSLVALGRLQEAKVCYEEATKIIPENQPQLHKLYEQICQGLGIDAAAPTTTASQKIEQVSTTTTSQKIEQVSTTTTSQKIEQVSTKKSDVDERKEEKSQPKTPPKPSSSSSSSSPTPPSVFSPPLSMDMKPPASGSEFVSNLSRYISKDKTLEFAASYLHLVDPVNIPRLVQTDADEETVMGIIKVVQQHIVDRDCEKAYGIMQAITRIPRISIVLGFLNKQDSQTLRTTLEELEKRGKPTAEIKKALLK